MRGSDDTGTRTAATHAPARPPGTGRGPAPRRGDPAPIRPATVRALGGAVGRELGSGLRLVGRRVAMWRRRAELIPDPRIRRDAIVSLDEKRYYADGAALFWTLPDRRDPQLLRLLVDFQVAANFLDHASERGAAERGACGSGLMLAFADAVDLDAAISDHYGDHPWSDDGGYLRALVMACRSGCAALPRYRMARPLLVREARRAHALELSHDPDPARRDAALRRFVGVERASIEPGEPALGGLDGGTARDGSADWSDDARWFERAAGAASAMTVIALLALAAQERTTDADLRAAAAAYAWVATLSTMLDSYVDQADDAATGDWSVIAHYGSERAATERLASLIDRALREVGSLRDGARHTVIVSSMVALFLSRDSARHDALAGSTRQLSRAGGSLTTALVPVLRAWRTASGQRAV